MLRWKEFMRTLCSMGADSHHVISEVLMTKVETAIRVLWLIRGEDGEVLTYVGMM